MGVRSKNHVVRGGPPASTIGSAQAMPAEAQSPTVGGAAPEPDQGLSAIRTTGLTKDYGSRRAIDDLTIDVPSGVVVGFVGPNGAGKTTTIRILLGLIAPTAGSAEVLGTPISRPSAYLPQVGALAEGPAFYPTLSGRRNLEVLAALGSIGHERVATALEEVELTERADDLYRTYSMGMKQRLGLAAALLPQPRLLILDEPVNGLDPAGILAVRSLFTRLAADGVTVFVSSHLLSEVQHVASWLVMLKEGRLIFNGPTVKALGMQRGMLVVGCEEGEPARVAALAAKAGYRAAVGDDRRIRIEAPVEFAGRLNRDAMRAGIVLNELHFERATLEDTFFALTEGGGSS
jgi:ABC-2 type transport system ATP-binding protein